MKEKVVTVGTLVCLVVLTCLLLVHALAIFPGVPAIRWFFVTSGVVLGRLDAPAWVQAVGSIVAIFAAIGIAMWQRKVDHRTTKEREQAAAMITAVSLHNMLGPIVGTLKGVKGSIAKTREHDAEERARKTHRTLGSLPLPTDDQLTTLHFVLPQVAADLAIGCSRLSHAVKMIGLVVQSEDLDGVWALERLQRLDEVLEVPLARASKARDALTSFINSQ